MNRVTDPFTRRMLVEVLEQRPEGLVLRGGGHREFYNVYGIAHGGYLYTLGHLAGELTAQLTRETPMDVLDVSCQYLNPFRQFPARVETRWLGGEGSTHLQVRVLDSRGLLCFQQYMTLGPAWEQIPHEIPTPGISTDRPLPHSCYEAPQFPCITSTFSRFLDIYSTRFQDRGLVYAVDPSPANTDGLGRVHPGAIFTAADAAAGGTLYYVDKKRPITVSGNIHYHRPAVIGPVSAIPRLVRGGKSLFYYDLDILDGHDGLVATAQFIIQNTRDYSPEDFQ